VEHDQAVATMAAEKYVLGELENGEREEFEEHFFNCPECARDMRDLSSIVEGVRLLPSPAPKTEPSKSRVSAWLEAWQLPTRGLGLAWAAALLLVGIFAGYQVTEFRNQVHPQTVASFLLRPETRGEALPVPVEQLGSFLLLEADLPGSAGSLQWDLRQAASNRVIAHDVAAAPKPGASFKVLLPVSLLAPAEYALSVRAATAPSDKTWLFRFRIGKS
jgi:hypothetical protein